MTTTLDPTPAAVPVDQGPAAVPAPSGRALWPLAGAASGVLALASVSFAMAQGLDDADYRTGPAVVDQLDASRYHAAFLLGLASIACLFVAAAGWKRWSEERAGRSLAARTISTSLAATATVNIVGVALAGSLALYLPGGMDEGWFAREGLYVDFTYLDFGLLFGWWAAMLAAACVAVVAFSRSRLLPRWMGAFSILAMIPATALGVVAALPGMPGFTMPIWLIVVSIGMVFAPTAGPASPR